MALNRQRVLEAGVALADEVGIESLSMRRLAQELGVVPMALYKHVAGKEELLDGMVDVLIGEIDPVVPDADWKTAVRARVLSARRSLQRHPWARQAVESRSRKSLAVLGYLDSVIGMFLDGGFTVDQTHHLMHAFGSRVWGLTQEVFEDPPANPDAPAPDPAMLAQLAQAFPHVARMALAADHDDATVVGAGCDDQFEFEFALDLLLDGFDRLKSAGWSSRTGTRLGT